MKTTATIITLAALAIMGTTETVMAKEPRKELPESDPWFGPAVRPPVNEHQTVYYFRTFSKKKRTTYERMMDNGDL
jgi:hypothetical protein